MDSSRDFSKGQMQATHPHCQPPRRPYTGRVSQRLFIALATLALALLLFWGLGERPSPRASALTSLLERAVAEPGLEGAAIGLCVLDATGAVQAAVNADTAFIPASSRKTVTTATALEVLGPDFRTETRLLAKAPPQEGVLEGDLVLRGGGDPLLSLSDLAAWAAELQRQGLRRIHGRVLGDGSLFTGSLYDDHWSWGDIGNGYGSPVAGLNLEHNRYSAVFAPGSAEGQPAQLVEILPEVPGITWINEVRTGPPESGDGVMIHGGERTTRLHLRGTVPADRPQFRVNGAVPDPETFAAHHLRAALLAAGIEVTGAAGAAESPLAEDAHVLHRHASPPLREWVASIHATSDNHETECLFRLLGLQDGQAPEEVVREHWRSRGLEFRGLRLEDGCGLARADGIRPRDLAELQRLAASGPQNEVYRASLVALRDGAVLGKGGAMSGVRSLTGLARSTSGETFFFALIVNHASNGAAATALREAVLDEILTW
jgi:serine-type D-Ala-D-Ala carboxypeptidase/endopeptidase (penicillin-binding protein 4)